MNCPYSKKQASSSGKGNKSSGGGTSKKCNCRMEKCSCNCRATTKGTVAKNTVAKGTVAKGTVAKDTVAKNTVAKNTVAKDTAVKDTVVMGSSTKIMSARKPPSTAVLEKCKDLVLSDEQVRWVMKNFFEEIEMGLKKETHDRATIKNYMTYVQDLPDGTEEGEYVALVLGGTKLRVLVVDLKQSEDCNIRTKYFIVPQEAKASGMALFDFFAACLSDFLGELDVAHEALPMGFTLSFPLKLISLTEGVLVSCSKDFDCSEIVGKDVVELLEEAVRRRGDVSVDVCAILNDTTGTLMSCAWDYHNCKIGVVVGTGTNACYLEQQSKCDFFDDKDSGSGTVIVSTEWGALGDDGRLEHLRTDYDREVDRQTVNVGVQVHEKMISGHYISELVRFILKHLIEEKVILGGRGAEHFAEKHLFDAGCISEIESDPPGQHEKCRRFLNALGVDHATDQDCTDIRYVCECVSRRSAHLVAAMIAALIHKIDDPDVTVGVDGSLYKYHPHYHNLLVEKIGELVKPGFKFLVAPAEDSGGRGAALVAAVYIKRATTRSTRSFF